MPDGRPTVHLLCGSPGAGKTTHARRLATERPAVRFSLDEWMLRLYRLRYDDPAYVARLPACTELIWDTAVQVLRLGHDVVLDWNQWSRHRRARWRDTARQAGYQVMLHHIDVPIEVAVARARDRADPAGSHDIDEAGVRHLAWDLRTTHCQRGHLDPRRPVATSARRDLEPRALADAT